MNGSGKNLQSLRGSFLGGEPVDVPIEVVREAVRLGAATTTTRTGDWTAADADHAPVQELTTDNAATLTLPDSVAAGTAFDVVLKGAGKLSFVPSGTATISGATRLYGSGSSARVYKATTTRWEILSDWREFREETVDFAFAGGLTNLPRIEAVDETLRELAGEDDQGGHGAEWDQINSLAAGDLRAGLLLDKRYSPGSSVPIDLTGNALATLPGAPTWDKDGLLSSSGAPPKYLSLAHSAEQAFTDKLTVIVRCAIQAGTQSGQRAIASKFVASAQGWVVRVFDGVLDVLVSADATGSAKKAYRDSAGTDLRDGQLRTIAFTMDTATDELKLFIDGTELTTTKNSDDTVAAIHAPTQPIVLGAFSDGNNSQTSTTLFKSFALLNAVLTPAEIAAYNP